MINGGSVAKNASRCSIGGDHLVNLETLIFPSPLVKASFCMFRINLRYKSSLIPSTDQTLLLLDHTKAITMVSDRMLYLNCCEILDELRTTTIVSRYRYQIMQHTHFQNIVINN